MFDTTLAPLPGCQLLDTVCDPALNIRCYGHCPVPYQVGLARSAIANGAACGGAALPSNYPPSGSYPIPIDSIDSAGVDMDFAGALAVTQTTKDINNCQLTADICVLFAFGPNACTDIPWYAPMPLVLADGANNAAVGNNYDMYSILVHEFGHYLGLGHSLNNAHVMNGFIEQGRVGRVPAAAEINAIQLCPVVATVPTLSQWGMIIFSLIFLAVTMVFVKRRVMQHQQI